MNKKVVTFIALAAILALSLTLLVACNPYKWDSIGGGDPDAATISNGGYFVRQGNYAYFINGYVGDNADNEFGSVLKQSIMRAELDENGNVKNDTAKVVVPKSIYNKNAAGGFAVYGDWIYYATPNNDKGKDGTPSTTHTDFMRTRIDGSITQLIATINSRETQYFFAPTRILYYDSAQKTISYIDFTEMKENKNIDNGKGAKAGVLEENVTGVIWNYDPAYVRGQTAEPTDYFFFTQNNTGDDNYLGYNNTYAMKLDGSDKKLIITKDSYLTEEQKNDGNVYQDKYYTIAFLGSVVEQDGSVTLFYTKSAGSEAKGLYCNRFTAEGFGALMGENKVEKQLTALNPTSIFPLGYSQGALVLKDSNYYLIDGTAYEQGSAGDVYEKTVIGRSATIQYVLGQYVYYTDSSSPKALYRINLNGVGVEDGDSPNETVWLSESIKIDWLKLEFDGSKFYFFSGDDYNYLHYIDLLTFDASAEDNESTFIGKMTQADAEAKQKAEEEEEKNKNN